MSEDIRIKLPTDSLTLALAEAMNGKPGYFVLKVSAQALANMISQKVKQMTGGFDDPDVDWTVDWATDDEGAFYLGGNDGAWLVSKDPHVGILVDAINIISVGKVIKLAPAQDGEYNQVGEDLPF